MRTCPRLALLLSPVLALLLVQGGGAFHASTHDLETTLADLTIQGALVDDQVGWEVASGDFNDDGIGDVLVGARQADGPSDSRGNAGDAYIILGPRTGTIDLFDEPADVTIYGADQNDQLGFSLAVGNVNGDQYDDIILGAYHADGQGTGTGCGVGQVGDSCDSGEAYVIFGRENLPNTIDVLAGDQDVTIYGAEDGDNLAVAVAAGDLDGDTLDDILLGADRADPSGGGDAGKAYVVYGDGSLPATIDLDGPPAGVLTVWGDDPDDRLGGSVGAGDLSGDGIADLIVSAHFADPASRLNAGEVYVIFGPQTGIINLDTASADLTVLGADAGDVLGLRVGAGDFSGDSQDDLLLGARYGDAADNLKSDTGEVYVFFGPRSGTIDLDTKVADLTVYGADDDDHLGIDLDAADVNADGTPDLVATAMHANAEGNLKPEAGEAYVVFGPRTGTVDLEQTPGDLRVLGVAEDDWLGRSLSTGDVSGDGIEDVLLGAIQADPESRSSAGEAYVLFGFASPDNTPVDGNVCVHLNGGLDAVGGIRVCFASVTSAGNTTVAVSTKGPPPPTAFRIVGLPGSPVIYYDIETTAGYTGPVEVCVHYEETRARNEPQVKLQHRQNGFVNITDPGYPDTDADIVCGTTSSLSIFAVMEPIPTGGTVDLASGSRSDARAQSPSRDHQVVVAVAVASSGAIIILAAAAWYTKRRVLG